MKTTKKSNLVAIFAIAALYSGTLAFAATEVNPPPQKLTPQQRTVNKDFSKVSADGSGAFMDLTFTRLAVFDGRIDAAKKYIDRAQMALSRAKTDETRFLRDEANLNAMNNTQNGNNMQNGANAPTTEQQNANNQQNTSNNKNVEWLPVDASITIDEDFTANPQKQAAVADANKSLSSGNRQASIDKLKLSGVNVNVEVLAVPLNDTIAKVQQAANMINDGKYYQASQLIKEVQDSARSDVMDFNGMPAKSSQSSNESSENQ